MEVTLQKHTSYITIPTRALRDPILSLEAKGFYTLLFTLKGKELNELARRNEAVLNELIDAGYAKKREKDYFIYINPQKNLAKVKESNDFPFVLEKNKEVKKEEKKKVSNLYTTMVDMVLAYTDDKDLQDALIAYFDARLRRKGKRFAEGYKLYPNMIKKLLSDLDSINDKVGSVNYCLENQYFKFFEKPVTEGLDGVETNSFTEADKKRIQALWDELEAAKGVN